MDNDDISALVKDLRERMGLTQEQLAHELGVTFNTVNRWENGRRRPNPYLLKRLMEIGASLDKVSQPRLTKAKPRALQKQRQSGRAAGDAELVSMPVAEKFHQLAKLMVSAKQLGWPEDLAAEEDEIRQRWMKLRRVLHV